MKLLTAILLFALSAHGQPPLPPMPAVQAVTNGIIAVESSGFITIRFDLPNDARFTEPVDHVNLFRSPTLQPPRWTLFETIYSSNCHAFIADVTSANTGFFLAQSVGKNGQKNPWKP